MMVKTTKTQPTAEHPTSKERCKNAILITLSLIPTPLIVFVSTSSSLYLRNQSDLDYQISVLLPFLLAFSTTLLIGLILTRLRRNRLFEYFLWIYYLTGPIFLLLLNVKWGTALSLPRLPTIAGSAFLLFTLPLILKRGITLKPLVGLMAIVGVLLTANEAITFAKNIETPPNETEPTTELPKATNNKLPNVYHLIIDAFQSDGFSLYLTPKIKKELGGFTYYQKNTSNYWPTRNSFPSFLTSTYYNFDEPLTDFKERAFDSDKSMIWQLKNAGYVTYSYGYQKFPSQNALFDYFKEPSESEDQGKLEDTNTLLFVRMWASSVLPHSISRLITPDSVAKELEKGQLLPSTQEVRANQMFFDLLKEEKNLPSQSRYTFMYILTTHSPYVFKSDCSYTTENGEISKTPVGETYQCAMQVIVQFIKTLKELNRYKSSLIVIQADHGNGLTVQNGNLQSIPRVDIKTQPTLVQAHANALLLIKPPGKSGEEKFKISQSETALVDLFPTVLDLLKIKPKPNLKLEGVSLAKNKNITSRQRYFVFGGSGDRSAVSEFLFKNGIVKLIKNGETPQD